MPPNAQAVNCTVTLSRRAAVVRGSRIAYAAPIVIASYRLDELEARAQEAVSQVEVQAAAALFPPVIDSVSFAAPSWVAITGRNLSDASVTFWTDQGAVSSGVIQLNTDTKIIVSIGDGLTITSTRVDTPEGSAIFDTQISPAPAMTEGRRVDQSANTQVESASDSRPAAEETDTGQASVASEAAADVPAADSVEEPAETAPEAQEIEEPTEQVAEEQPVEAQVPEPIPTEAPVEEPVPPTPVPPAPPPEEAPPRGPTGYAVGVEVIVGPNGAAMYDAPSAGGNLIADLRPGSRMVIVGPSQQGDGGPWWQVQDYESGSVGFVEEWRLIARP